eukprot:CAMPEP_0182603282 /NCGR_PEP_ID=MMETSP1324-20130603/92418_1 /TAXON_ID=236786 /ORGANISM="Florenciella sp., Strain RCC1587" /LENGTH=114 /DNA_ID=CAMNT_0024821213 /DNA_START=84 /DNA_END=427 /DNA_ORIENTATION=+
MNATCARGGGTAQAHASACNPTLVTDVELAEKRRSQTSSKIAAEAASTAFPQARRAGASTAVLQAWRDRSLKYDEKLPIAMPTSSTSKHDRRMLAPARSHTSSDNPCVLVRSEH